MSYSKTDMIIRKQMFQTTSAFLSALSDYSYGEKMEENKQMIDFYYTDVFEPLILPSDNKGTLLALALEHHYYQAAKYMLENKQRLGITLNDIATNKDTNEQISFEDEFKFSTSYYDEKGELNRINLYKTEFNQKYIEHALAAEKELEAKRYIEEYIKNNKTSKTR